MTSFSQGSRLRAQSSPPAEQGQPWSFLLIYDTAEDP